MDLPTLISLPILGVLGGIFIFFQILIENYVQANSEDPWSDTPLCSVWSGSALFAYVP